MGRRPKLRLRAAAFKVASPALPAPLLRRRWAGFTALQWQQLQSLSGGRLSDADRAELEQAGLDFWSMRDHKVRRAPSPAEKRKMRRQKQRGMPVAPRTPLDEVWASRWFQRRADAHRDLMVERIMVVTWRLFPDLPFKRGIDDSRRAASVALGVPVRFLTGVLRAILRHEAPTSSLGIVELIVSERARRKHFAAEAEKYLARKKHRRPRKR